MKNPSIPPPAAGSKRLTRRSFIKKTSAFGVAAAFPSIIPASALGRDGAVLPSERIVVGVVGCGPQGQGDLGNFLNNKDCQVVAVCDVSKKALVQARDKVNEKYGSQDCRTYGDFRELMQRRDIDACLVATPDHWHVGATLAAIESGKDVYMEKPLAPSLEEGQRLRAAVKKHKRVFQFGTQQRSGKSFRLACQLVRNGHIGELKHINVWAPGSTPGGSLKQVDPPDFLDYDFWLGPVHERPYTENLCSQQFNKKTWWFISDFTLGFISGWGIHPLDIALWGGGERLGGTVEVEGRGNFRCAEGICDTATIWEVDFRFSSGVTLKFVGVPNGNNSNAPTGEPWLHGDEWKQRYRRISTHGTAFEGTEGWVHVDRGGLNLEPPNLIDLALSDFKVPLIHSPGQVRNFLDCIRGREETVSSVDAAVASDILCHVADIAIRLRRKVTFDFARERFVKDREANRRLRARPARAPWGG